MTKLKSILILSIEFLLILYCTTGTTTGAACGISSNDNKSVQSGGYLDPEVSNVDYNHLYYYFFGLNSYGNTVITRYGKLPLLETEEQRESWNSTLEEVSSKVKDTAASKYMYPHGKVVTCGINSHGYFVILFKYSNVDKPLLSEIYTLIDSSAREMGIQNVPVEFGYGTYWGEIPLDLEKGIYHVFGESTENLSESDIHAIEKYMKEKPTRFEGKTIAAYGKIPLLKDRNEQKIWFDKLNSVKNDTEDKILPYLEKGQVITYGHEFSRLQVGIYENFPPEEKTALAEEIYCIIDEEARKQNVTDIPVIFEDSGMIQPAEEVIEDGGSVEEELNNSKNNDSKPHNGGNPKVNGSNGNESSKDNSAPGFGLLGGLACLYSLWRFRKK
jgi:hypothetical protein